MRRSLLNSLVAWLWMLSVLVGGATITAVQAAEVQTSECGSDANAEQPREQVSACRRGGVLRIPRFTQNPSVSPCQLSRSISAPQPSRYAMAGHRLPNGLNAPMLT